MDVIIHAGYYKTATTSIQAICQMNRQRLLQVGLLYPQSGLRRNTGISHPMSMGHHLLYHGVRNATRRPKLLPHLEALKTQFGVEVEGAGAAQVLISTELLSSANLQIKSAFLDLVTQEKYPIRIVYAVGLPHLLAESMLKQALRFHKNPSVPDLVATISRRIQTDLSEWIDLVGQQNVHVHFFSKKRYKPFLLLFLQSLGIAEPATLLASDMVLNASVSPQGIAARQQVYQQLMIQGVVPNRRMKDRIEIEASLWEASLPADCKTLTPMLPLSRQLEILESGQQLLKFLRPLMSEQDWVLFHSDWIEAQAYLRLGFDSDPSENKLASHHVKELFRRIKHLPPVRKALMGRQSN
jgi:hypothetical protein